jgi:cytoskeleton-associated protein 5
VSNVGLGDSKTWVKSASLQCINEWVNQCGIPSVFDGEMVFDALKTGGPILRAELWTWLSEKLPTGFDLK